MKLLLFIFFITSLGWNIVLNTNKTLNILENFNYTFSNTSSLLGVRWTLNSTRNFEVILYNSTQNPFINTQFQYFRIPRTKFSFQEFFNTTKQLSIFIRNLENNEPQTVFITLEELYPVDNLPLILGLSISLPLIACCFCCCCQIWTCLIICCCAPERKEEIYSYTPTYYNLPSDARYIFMGAGDGGKSTFFKHVRIVMGDDSFLQKEESIYVNTTYANIIFTVAALYSYIKSQNIDISNEEQEIQDFLQECYDLSKGENLLLKGSQVYTQSFHASMVKLVNRSFFITTLPLCRIPYHVFEGAEYFLKNIDRLDPPKYQPNTQDALHCRRKTTGMVEFVYGIDVKGREDKVIIKFVDVGGQRNERKKWASFYDKTNIPVFMCPLTEFDQVCYEDDTTNRMIESLDCFDEFANGLYKDHDIVILLTKKDLFTEKIKSEDFSSYFQDYQGEPSDSRAIIQFITQKYLSLNRNPNRNIYVYDVNCLEKDDVKFVMEKLADIVTQKFLKEKEMVKL